MLVQWNDFIRKISLSSALSSELQWIEAFPWFTLWIVSGEQTSDDVHEGWSHEI